MATSSCDGNELDETYLKDAHQIRHMQEIPIYSTKLSLFNMPMRKNDVPLQLAEWKLVHFVINLIVCVVMFIVSGTTYRFIMTLQVLQFMIQISNLQMGSWGDKNGWIYCNIDEQVKSGQNTVRLISTAVTEAVVAFVAANRFAAAAVLFMYRSDSARRAIELGEQTETSRTAKDLESLHAAQPTRPPIFGIDIAIPAFFCLLWYNSPMILVHFGVRAAVIVCRDLSIISPIQTELYSDVVTTFSLTIVIVYIILFY